MDAMNRTPPNVRRLTARYLAKVWRAQILDPGRDLVHLDRATAIVATQLRHGREPHYLAAIVHPDLADDLDRYTPAPPTDLVPIAAFLRSPGRVLAAPLVADAHLTVGHPPACEPTERTRYTGPDQASTTVATVTALETRLFAAVPIPWLAAATDRPLTDFL